MELVTEHFDERRLRIDDAAQVLEYLAAASMVRAATGVFPDRLVAGREYRDAGEATDGVFVWPVAVAYYLTRYQIAPPERLLVHIREQAYQCPPVSERDVARALKAVRRAAVAA